MARLRLVRLVSVADGEGRPMIDLSDPALINIIVSSSLIAGLIAALFGGGGGSDLDNAIW